MIDELTPLQEQMLAAKIDYWHSQVCSTRPLERTTATLALCDVYTACGFQPPKVVFLSSPLACLVAWGMLWAGGHFEDERPLDFGLTIRQRVHDALHGACKGGFYKEISRELLAAIIGQLRDRWTLMDRLTSSVQRQIRHSLANSHRVHALLEEVQAQLPSGLITGSWWQLRTRMLVCMHEMDRVLRRMCHGSWDRATATVLHDCCVGLGGLPAQDAVLTAWLDQCRWCHGWIACDGLVLASDRPCRLSMDPRGRLHDPDAAALEYRDGTAIHAWHGVEVAPWIIIDPASITVQRIEAEANVEVRRVMLERHGWTRYMAECGAKVVDSIGRWHRIAGLRGARLLRKELPGEPEPLVYLEMVNSTPEPDGTYRRYLERIDPKAYNGLAGLRVHAAMASRWHHRDETGRLQRTFASWRDYLPTRES